MNSKRLVVAAALVLVMSVSGCNNTAGKDTPTITPTLKQDRGNSDSGDGAQVNSAGIYEDYAEAKLAKHPNDNIILFFSASWCPTCKALDKDIEANISSAPANLSIFKVDYDYSLALKQKYGVTYQHTLVKVDAQGNMLKKWNGSPTLSDLVSQANS